jgi:protein SCO1/2
MAAKKKAEFLKRYKRGGAEQGWHFLVGDQGAVDSLTKAAGFQYQYDEKTKQFAHATAIMILTPEGKIAQYYYGVEYPPKDLRLGLVEAGQRRIGNVVDQLLLYCYHYDPEQGKYSAVILRVVRLAGLATMLFLGSFIFLMIRRGTVHDEQGVGRVQ